jgi:general secretion pathway protein C
VGGTPPPKPAVVTSHEILTDYIRPNPKYEGETLRGYEVYAGQSSGVFFQMGLQGGDVITAINGVPLSEPQSAIEQLRQLTQGVAVTATIERKGQSQTLSLDGALIIKDQERAKNALNNPGVNMPPM